MKDAVTAAIDRYKKMEHDAKIMQALRDRRVLSITHGFDDWRVDVPGTFTVAPTLDEALEKLEVPL